MSNLNLMVGDWVMVKEERIRVDIMYLQAIVKGSIKHKPIPLSLKVMENIESISKNENRGTRYGFLDGYYNIDRDTDLVAIIEDDGLLYIYTYEYSHEQFQLVCTFQYLHQLQQLIRLLTGKEIEVKWE